MCQLDWAMGCLGIWPNIILSVPLRVFLNENNVWTGRMNEAETASLMCVDLIQWVQDLNRTKRLSGEEFLLSDSLGAVTLVVLVFRLKLKHNSSGSPASWQQLWLVSFHNCLSQFILYMYIFYRLVLFL